MAIVLIISGIVGLIVAFTMWCCCAVSDVDDDDKIN